MVAEKPGGRGGDEAGAKDEGHDRYDKDLKKKRGSTQHGRHSAAVEKLAV